MQSYRSHSLLMTLNVHHVAVSMQLKSTFKIISPFLLHQSFLSVSLFKEMLTLKFQTTILVDFLVAKQQFNYLICCVFRPAPGNSSK